MAKGKVFMELAAHPKGGGSVKCDGKTCCVYREELKNTDEELVRKFSENVSEMFSFDQAEVTAHRTVKISYAERGRDWRLK